MIPTLRDIFATLNEAGLPYALLRGEHELEHRQPLQEIDLLVEPQSLGRFAALLAQWGFVALPNWGYKPHHFFVAFAAESNTWLKFDVVTELCYGKPYRLYRIDLAAQCLRQRTSGRMIAGLAPEHEFFTLLLHRLLDKACFTETATSRLQALFRQVQSDAGRQQNLHTLIARYLAPALTLDKLTLALERGDWDYLLNQRRKLERHFYQKSPLAYELRRFGRWLLLKSRPLLFALRRRGITIALLAADGAGKSTLAQALAGDPILKARLIYMGGNTQARTVGLPTTAWLMERMQMHNGTLSRTHPLRVATFLNKLAETRYRALVGRLLRLQGRIVVFDRYFYDAWLKPRSRSLWKRLRRLLFEGGFPQPDLVIFLDAPGTVLYARKGEHSPEWLQQQRQRYLSLRHRLPNMIIVDATQAAEDVAREVKSLIWSFYRFRITRRALYGTCYASLAPASPSSQG